VGLPSVIPPAALKRAKHILEAGDPDPPRGGRPGAAPRRPELSGSRPDRGLRQSSTAGTPFSGRSSRELSRSAVDRLAPQVAAARTMVKGKKPRRKIYLPISPLAVLFLLGLAAAFYFLYVRDRPWKEISHDEPSKMHEGAGESPAPSNPFDRSALKTDPPGVAGPTVTLWLDVEPFEAQVTLNGTPVSERPITVPKSDTAIQLRVTAPRKEPLSVDVVPDKDRTVKLHLQPAGSK
jgi:hypothetical protein